MSILSERILQVSTVYLGPAAKTFLDRQTKHHMNGLVFDNIEKQHLPELCKWINVSAGLIIGKDKSREFADKVAKL
ncbi:hypothetical protein CUJ83_01300 [Methanocella sp. CWC-04]|uniref:Uncharacterized protein n=1 Tax=Methanooceanicella nereidis TaxID=2052831 RepID=A0AAP2RB33_9EURY|nr:hypothetical protein [Methanocella sp. CWC-04]MCD1293631.1 hypothetical protein [Methanocella sp. CWC-04]